MPDWSYRTLFRPLLYRLRPATARDITLTVAEALARLPGPVRIIECVGGTRPPEAARCSAGGLEFRTRVGLATGIDVHLAGLRALEQCGMGFVEVGMEDGAAIVAARIRAANLRIPVAARIGNPAEIAPLVNVVEFFSIDAADPRAQELADAIGRVAHGTPIVWVVPANHHVVQAARERLGPSATILAAGVTHPLDGPELVAAGADLLSVGMELVQAGPNFAPRVTNALLASQIAPVQSTRSGGWVAIMFMGVGIATAGVVAWLLGLTRVLLPYDEAISGLTLAQLQSINGRLLPFMAHDRVSFGGALISLGLTYAFLAYYGLRRGLPWVRSTILVSSLWGFLGFFVLLATRYFDPVHAAATALLFVFFIVGIVAKPPREAIAVPDDRDERARVAALWGQLLLIFCGIGFAIGGAAVCTIGITTLLVQTDLAFLGATRDALASASPHLLPLIAHDRGYFGQTLLANGINWTAAALWGFRRGERWLWWMFALTGVPGFAAAISIHAAVGYTAFEHLLPVYFALALWGGALVLSRRYLLSSA